MILGAVLLASSLGQALTLSRSLDPGWSLVSVPIDPYVKDVTTVFDAFARPLRVTSYVQNDLKLPEDAAFPDIVPGRAFWIYLEGRERLEVDGALTKSNTAYDIPVTRGWNPIGNPWGVPLEWSDDRVSFLVKGSTDAVLLSEAIDGNRIEGTLKGYGTGSWFDVIANATPVEKIEPWAGYMLYANFDGTLRVNPPTVDNTPPVVEILSPETAAEVTSLAGIIGTASDSDLVQYSLQYAPTGSNTWTTFASGNASIADATLGVFDPTMLLNGQYDVRLLASDLAGNNVGVVTSLVVDGGQKIGPFTVSYVDVNVPLANMPIQVVRTYDSRNKGKGDFGYGWTLDIGDIKVEQNRDLGNGWYGNRSGGGFPTYCIEEDARHVVSIAFPDGTVHRFEPVLSPVCQSFFPIQDVSLSFRPRPGSQGRLEARGDTSGYVLGGWPGPISILDYDTAAPLEITSWRYVTQDDLVIEFSEERGLERLIDPAGNILTIHPDGIDHSSGKGVDIERDSDNRITHITDPMGNVHRYEYDEQGDLAAYTDPLGNTSRYTYNRKHQLIDIRDPLGRMVTRNEYDDSGRLIATTDARGNRVELDYDIEGNQQVVRDPMGNISRYVYDGEGNGILEEKSVTIEGQTVLARTEREYDSENNMTLLVDPDGVRTEYEYDSNNNQTKIILDPDGLNIVTSNDYGGGCCRLQSTTDPNGFTTTYTYNDQGKMLSRTDPPRPRHPLRL